MRLRSVWAAMLVSLLALTMASGVVFADRPDENGNHDHGGGETANISVFNFGYDPASFDPTGTTVTWKVDEGKHTITFFDLAIDSGRLKKGQTFEADFTGVSPGTYGYFCTIHGSDRMSGEIIVN